MVVDPDAALREREEPVLLDEWQETPGVLGAVNFNSARPLGFTSGVAWSTLGDTGK